MNNRKVKIGNKLLETQPDDHLYHIGISKRADNVEQIYGGVKFVCAGGSSSRIERFAEMFADEMHLKPSANLSSTDRYVLYKTGPVLWVNHGIGGPSLSIVLNELIKLLYYANTTDVTFFRIGTCGGIGVPPGTVVISSGCLNGELQESYAQFIMGKKVLRTSAVDQKLKDELNELALKLNLPVEVGKTLAADEFYEGQARLDGAFCEYTAKDKFAFLSKLYDLGVRNMEMESTCFAALLHRANIRAAVVCVTILNRMNGDQVELTRRDLEEVELRPYKLISTFIAHQLRKH